MALRKRGKVREENLWCLLLWGRALEATNHSTILLRANNSLHRKRRTFRTVDMGKGKDWEAC